MKTYIKIKGERFYPLRHLFLLALAFFWLIPIFWLVLNSFSSANAMSISRFFPKEYSLIQYKNLLFNTDAANQFPRWMLNTTVIAVFNCLISSMFVLMTAYSISRMRFSGRKFFMNLSMILGLFPGFLSMIAIYFILKTFNSKPSSFIFIYYIYKFLCYNLPWYN